MDSIAIHSRSYPTTQEAERVSEIVHAELGSQIPHATFTMTLEDEDDEGGVVAVLTDVYLSERAEMLLLAVPAWRAGREITLSPEDRARLIAVVTQGPDSFTARFGSA